MPYDISTISRRLHESYVNHVPPRVTPKQLRPLLDYLWEITKIVSEHQSKVARYLMAKTGATQTLWDQYRPEERALNAWTERITVYRAALDACDPDDAQCSLWTVVAPLFYGYYGGPTSTEPRGVIDLITVFKIANTFDSIVQADVVSNYDAAIDALESALLEAPGLVSDAVTGTLRGFGQAIGAGIGGIGGGIGKDSLGTLAMLLGGALAVWYFFIRKTPREPAHDEAEDA